MDIIQRLRELRQSSQSSVVIGLEPTPSDDPRPQVTHPIEGWLINLILDQLTAPDTERPLSLIVLSGNAGDGKSYLLREVRQRLEVEDNLEPNMVTWLLDATESRHQSQRSVDRLDAFFAPFANTEEWRRAGLHVIAMNTGTVVQFLDHDHERGTFSVLCDILSLQLAIRREPETEDPHYWDRFDRVLTIDLDRRMLVPFADNSTSFLDRMLSTLDRNAPGSLFIRATTDCDTCPAMSRCPVHANIIALQNPRVRQRLDILLRDIALEDRIHLGPRTLWHLVYRMTIGGLDAAAIAARRPLPTCSEMSNIDDGTRAGTLFFSALFDAPPEKIDTGGPALVAELVRVDPATRFTLDALEDALAAGLSPDEDRRLSEPLAGELGIAAEALVGPRDDAKRRAMVAVQRAFFLGESEPDPDRHGWLRTWSESLLRHGRDVLEARITRHDTASVLKNVLIDIYAPKGRTNLWHLNLPWRNQVELYARLDLITGPKKLAFDVRVLGPDAYRPSGVRPVVRELADHLDALPLSITVSLGNGPVVRITWPLYRLLMRVDDQQYVAATLDTESVQNLERIGASLGAQAAINGNGGVVVLRHGGVLCRDDGAGGYDVVDL